MGPDTSWRRSGMRSSKTAGMRWMSTRACRWSVVTGRPGSRQKAEVVIEGIESREDDVDGS